MKQVSFQEPAQPDQVGTFTIGRALPNQAVNAVGPFLLLDHLPKREISAGELPEPDGSFAHPHAGIVTFTYVMEGAMTHFDSLGNNSSVTAGGVQWMKAGNGIVHDEMLATPLRRDGGVLHSFQFWINLPAPNKIEPAQYMPVSSPDLPVAMLAGGRGEVKVLLGQYDGQSSPIPTYAGEFIWHVRIEPLATVDIALHAGLPVAGFLPTHGAVVGDAKIDAHTIIGLDAPDGTLEITNPAVEPLDLLLFGGEAITDPIAMRGPFVMNSDDELAQAFRAYRAGKFGQITYPADHAAHKS
jgi:redox-sensitive bicupin YhaK (pirin superfamily)